MPGGGVVGLGYQGVVGWGRGVRWWVVHCLQDSWRTGSPLYGGSKSLSQDDLTDMGKTCILETSSIIDFQRDLKATIRD